MDLKDALVKFDLNSENHALGTDKDSTHSYVTKFYDGLFQVIPPVNILIEIGIWKGASCVLWKKRFPEARVIGYDIVIEELHPLAAIMNVNGEIELKEADAYDKSILSLMPGEIDLLIDDGPHTLHSQALALNQFNKLSKNGTIVVEDIAHGIVDIRKLLASLPADIRKKCEWVTFSHQTGRFDDTLIILSNSLEVLNYVRQLRRSINAFCLHSSMTFYIYRTYFKLMVLLGVRKYK